MYAVERLSSYISRGVYSVSGPFHPFGGAVDIIVVEQQDGSFKSSPWYVRFGKFQGVLKTREKIVNIGVNGVETNFHMYLDHKGEAFFLEEVDVEEGKSLLYSSSLSSGDERDENTSDRRPTKSKSCNFDANGEMALVPIDASSGKIVPRTTSRRGRLLGLVFGGNSMKPENFREKESDADITRVSSLERAEIAADLLEVRWTTGLATKNIKKDKASQFSAEDSLDTKDDANGKLQTALCVNEDREDGSDPSRLREENGFCDGEMSNKSQSSFQNSECSVGEASLEMSCLSTTVEASALNEINLGKKYELSEISRVTNEVTDADHDDDVKSVTFSITCSDSQFPDPAELEVGSCEQFNGEAFEERNAVLSDHDVVEENEQDRVQSFIYCETSGCSAVGLDGSIKETQETLYLACGESGDSHIHAGTLHETTELISETQVLDIIHQHTVTERLVEDIKSEAKPPKVPENQSQQSSPSYSCMPANVEAGFEGSLVMQESYTEMVRVDSKLDSAEETISHGSFTISSFGDSGHVQCNEIIRDEKTKSELQPSLESTGDSQELDGDYAPTKVTAISPPESSSFSDPGHVQCNEIIRDEKTKSELQPSLESIGDSREFDGDCVPTKVRTISPPESSSFSDSGYVHCNEIIRDEKMKSELQPSLESIGDSQEFSRDCVPTKVTTISPPESSSLSDSGHAQCNEIIRDEITKSELQPSLESIGDSQEFNGDSVPTKVRTISPPESSSFSDSDHVQCSEMIRDEKKKSELQPSLDFIGNSQEFDGDCLPTKVTTISPPESSDEEQFLFSDLDDVKHSEVQLMDPMEEENSPSLILDYESYSSPDSSVQENPPDDLDNLMDNSRVVSSPIIIPSSVKVTGEEVERLAESLPNMGPCGDDLDAHVLHRTISHSMDSNSKSLGWALLRDNISTFTNSNANNKHILVQEQLSIDNTQISRELKNILANPDVEISLCKHLLNEGMGAAAASEAFDAEKLDIDKFASLDPDVLKKDNLVVRIRGHYYPWEAATPIVLGRLSFGKERIHELKGMIAVDQVEKTLEGDPSKAVVASGGSWRLWPFPFRRSRVISSVQPAIVNTIQSDSENAKETTAGMDGNSCVSKPKLTKKKVRVITPTSEQLASLNLKEGRNTITFTFSTAMLGKQQVDARIYLWKWNTRIVISDVDGTITKSDVLGQFMPMVGVDWSQTGVAHLFSAIKENGYQLLFLSARSISQAYLTRQFLFNLKQDGKALPDGPVVISPDGLFPSLYREVIRRAPHEFKIACLEDIRVLFPSDCNPFYAGFGNRDTDEVSYLKVGIPKGKIFIINPKGEVAVNRLVDTKSYTSLHALVNRMFPPTSSSEQEDFNSWNYWRLPPPVVDI